MSKKNKNKSKDTKAVKELASPVPTSHSDEYVPKPLNSINDTSKADSSEIFDFIPELKGKKY